MNTQTHHLLITMFYVIYALEVVYVYWIYMVEILDNGIT